MTLPVINGREAVPVRLMPFLTRWRLSPDVLILLFAGQHPHFHERWKLKAWREQGGPLKRSDWGMLEITEVVAEQFSDWKREAIEFLPGDVFAWRDEFEAEFHRLFDDVPFFIPRAGAPELTEEQEDSELEKMLAEELAKEYDPEDCFKSVNEVKIPRWLKVDEDALNLDFDPSLSPGERSAVFGDFAQFMPSASAAVSESNAPAACGHTLAATESDTARVVSGDGLRQKHRHRWPKLNEHLKRAADNGLRAAAAVSGRRGWWYEEKALEWAEARGALDQVPALSGAWPAKVHRMDG
jgi:hypothetical protein